jgi:hypothetical protein
MQQGTLKFSLPQLSGSHNGKILDIRCQLFDNDLCDTTYPPRVIGYFLCSPYIDHVEAKLHTRSEVSANSALLLERPTT